MGRIRAPIFRPNWSHPLNRGRVAWWLCQPNKLGGGTWFDLCGHYHGALTNMGGASGATNGFRSTTRPGGWGAVLCAANGSLVNAARSPQPNSISLAIWAKPVTISGVQMLLVNRSGFSESSGATWFINSGTLEFWASINNSGAAWQSQLSAGTATAGQWIRLFGTYDAATGQNAAYVNGRLISSGSITAAPLAWNSASGNEVWRIGGDDLSDTANSFLDDVSIYSRALTAAEVQLDYTLSRQRYPGVLQSMPLRTYSVPSAGPAGNGLLMRRRRFLLGAA